MAIAPRRSSPDPRSNTELLQAASSGVESFTTFYRRNAKDIIAYFWRRTRDRTATADLTAETFAVAWEHINKFDPTRGDGGQWLQGIASNLLKKFWRKTKATSNARDRLALQAVTLSDEAAREIEIVDAKLDTERLSNAMNRLPTKNREAVHLRIVEDLDYNEIARRLGCEGSTARMRVLRGLKRMRQEFDQPQRSAEVGPHE